jgi:hypothetical protein
VACPPVGKGRQEPGADGERWTRRQGGSGGHGRAMLARDHSDQRSGPGTIAAR